VLRSSLRRIRRSFGDEGGLDYAKPIQMSYLEEQAEKERQLQQWNRDFEARQAAIYAKMRAPPD
jgi:hypothetical protein